MKGIKYDIDKLNKSGLFDTSAASKFYYNIQDYFDALTYFIDNNVFGFSNYTPAFVVNSDEDRCLFLKECFDTRAEFTRLGMAALLQELDVMENAANKRDMKEFSDGQIKLRASIEICIRALRGAAMRWRIGV